MSYYSILECTQTLRFWRWGRVDFNLWVPLERRWNPEAAAYTEIAALIGYAFVPESRTLDCLRAAPHWFNARLMVPRAECPALVHVSELEAMQYTINSEQLKIHGPEMQTTEADRLTLEVGQKIMVLAPPFSGLEGVVVSSKTETTRVLIGKRYVTLSPYVLKKI